MPVGVFGTAGIGTDGSIGTEAGAGIAVGAFAGRGFAGGVNVQAGQPPSAELAFVFAVAIPGTGVGPIFDTRVSLDTIGARAQIGLARGAGVLGFIGVVGQGPSTTFDSVVEFFEAAGRAGAECGAPCLVP